MEKSYLLDTHTLLWFLSGDQRLSKKSKRIILNSRHKCFVSIASLWEIAIKISLGKLRIEYNFSDLADLLVQNDIQVLQISFAHLLTLLDLETVHRDPFDRIIISMGKHDNLSIISKDENFTAYFGVTVIW